MSRIFQRPMFRTGGSAEGITSGLRRGFAHGGPEYESNFPGPGTYHKGMPTEIEEKEVVEEAPSLPFAYERIDPPEAPGFDWGTFGLNLMSGPSEGDIFSDIGTAGKEPWSRYKQGKSAYEMNKYKHKLSERQFGLEVYKAMNKDDKLKVQQEMDWYISQGMSEEEAFNTVIHRKKQHPAETKRIQDQAALEEQKENLTILLGNYADDDLGQGVALTPAQGKKVSDFHQWAEKNGKQFQPYHAVIDNTDMVIGQLQTSGESGNKILPEGTDLETYRPGFHYIDPMTNTIWLVSDSGAELIPVEMD